MKLTRILLALMLIPMGAVAQNWDQTVYETIESSISEPQFAQRDFPITKYGAKLTATPAKNQKAINKAILACSKKGGGRVIVPAGTWQTGPITLKSNVNLHLEQGATLLFAFDTSLFPIVRTRWEGMDLMNYQPCIYAYNEKNVAITGQGVIDGNGSNETWWPMCGKDSYGWTPETTESQKIGRPLLFEYSEADTPIEERQFRGKGLRPQLINLYRCENILLEGVTLLRSPFWVVHPLLSKNITVRGLTIINDGPNGDGCDPESCENVLIENCRFQTGDDCIAIKSGRNADGRKWNTPSKNIIVRGCTMADGHGGVVIGSEITGGCQNVFVENCEMDSPNLDRVLRIKTNTCRGGVIENIYMRNVRVGQCREAVMRINLNYEPNEVARRGFIPTVRNVFMEDVTCQKSRYGILLNGIDEADNVYNINVSNCRFNGVTDAPVKLTGKSHDLHFRDLYVNDQLVVLNPPFVMTRDGQPETDKAGRLVPRYSEWLTWSEIQRTPQPYMLDFAKKPRWSYVMGIEQEAMLDTWLAYGDSWIMDYLRQYPEKMIDQTGAITGYKYDDFNLDNVRTAKYIFRLNKLAPQANVEKALKTLFRQLEKQPRTKEGVWWHKAIYANQVWLDGIFMGLPYYTLAAPSMVKPRQLQKYYDDAVDQILKTDQRTFDAQTKLWKHAWDETRSMFWADPTTGQSQHTWGRALGWYVMAMVEVLEALPDDYARKQEIVSLLQKAMKEVVRHQDKKTGVWHDVLDVDDERNYLEASCSSMFAYVLLKASRKGWLDDTFRAAGIKAFNGIVKEFVRTNPDGTISLTRCCEVSGLGPDSNPRRDGSFDYYISEPIRDNDAKGVGPFIWAALEMEQL